MLGKHSSHWAISPGRRTVLISGIPGASQHSHMGSGPLDLSLGAHRGYLESSLPPGSSLLHVWEEWEMEQVVWKLPTWFLSRARIKQSCPGPAVSSAPKNLNTNSNVWSWYVLSFSLPLTLVYRPSAIRSSAQVFSHCQLKWHGSDLLLWGLTLGPGNTEVPPAGSHGQQN